MPPHHAIAISADSLEAAVLPAEFLTPSLDVVHYVADRLAIDTVRDIIRDAFVKPVSAVKRSFVIVARDIPIEAQNALLKLLEEPPTTARFILIVPRIDVLLPTVRSRVLVLPAPRPASVPAVPLFAAFQTAAINDRLDMVAAWAKNKDYEAMEAVLRGTELFLHTALPAAGQLLKTTLLIRDYMSQSGAAKKMLLEELALSLPQA